MPFPHDSRTDLPVIDAGRPDSPGGETPGGRYAAAKSVSDGAFALSLLILTAPLIALAAAAIKLTSRGPVFYSQVRLGRGGRPFRIYKLRTMRHDCEKESGARWCVPGDPRVTPVGHFLRRTHI